MRGGSTRKGYLFKAAGTSMGIVGISKVEGQKMSKMLVPAVEAPFSRSHFRDGADSRLNHRNKATFSNF